MNLVIEQKSTLPLSLELLEGRLPQSPLSPHASREDVVRLLNKVDLGRNAQVFRALNLAEKTHANQRRDDGSPYLEQHIYPVIVAVTEHEMRYGRRPSAALVATAATHDVPEDSDDISDEQLYMDFGDKPRNGNEPSAFDLMRPLTKEPWSEYPGRNELEKRRARDEVYHNTLNASEYETVLVKLADRCNNLACSHRATPMDKLQRYIRDTEEYYVPLAKQVSPYFYAEMLMHIEVLCLLFPDLQSERVA